MPLPSRTVECLFWAKLYNYKNQEAAGQNEEDIGTVRGCGSGSAFNDFVDPDSESESRIRGKKKKKKI
jgi:hypothetical protein